MPKPRKDPRRRGNRRRYAYALAGFLLVLGYGLWKSQGSGGLAGFNVLASAGQTRLESTAVPVLADRSHLPPGQTIRYANLPPTSGPHSPRDVATVSVLRLLAWCTALSTATWWSITTGRPRRLWRFCSVGRVFSAIPSRGSWWYP